MQKKPVILINAATVKIAGGLIVSFDLVKLLVESDNYELVLVCPDLKKFRRFKGSCQLIFTPSLLLRRIFRIWLDWVWLPKTIGQVRPDLLITLGNLPARSQCRQIMFNDNAFVTEKKLCSIPLHSGERLKHRLRKWMFLQRIRFLRLIVVQTQTELNKLLALPGFHLPAKVLPPLLPSHLTENTEIILLPGRRANAIRLACVSYYWSHKNLEILCEVLRLAHAQDLKLQIVFTLNEKKVRGGKNLVNNLQPWLNDNSAINVGNIPANRVMSLIDQCDGVILPSLVETFGLNCLETWYAEKTYFVSDLAYAREVCGNAAVYFNPLDASDILNKIVCTFGDDALLRSLKSEGQKKIANWNPKAEYLDLFQKFLAL
ncbi:MAG: glycosyltransferase [Bacteroidota bacterium]|nr:MAG: glycosyltransferase [Bacteroidota bacterium]